MSDEPFVLPPEQGRNIDLGNFMMTVKASGDSTGNAFTLLEATEPPNFGPPMHIHHNAAEAFYVLEGEIEYRLDERLVRCEKGARLPHGTEASTNVNDTSRVAADSGISRSRV